MKLPVSKTTKTFTRPEKENPLFSELEKITGISQDIISEELDNCLDKVGTTASEMTLDDLREAMMAYLAEVMSEVAEHSNDQE